MSNFNLQREVSVAALRLERNEFPRLQMLIIVALASAIGFLTTFVLLRWGIHQLWLRYACALSVGYGAFLGMLWCWLKFPGVSVGDLSGMPGPSGNFSFGGARVPGTGLSPGGGDSGGAGASGSFDADGPQIALASDKGLFSSDSGPSLPDVGIPDIGDAGSDGDALPLIAIIAAIVAVAGLVGAVLATAWIVIGAPTFFGELVVDAALARGLYKHVKGSYDYDWLKTAMRRTFKAFLCLLVLLIAAGALMQMAVPGIVSVGQFVHYLSQHG